MRVYRGAPALIHARACILKGAVFVRRRWRKAPGSCRYPVAAVRAE